MSRDRLSFSQELADAITPSEIILDEDIDEDDFVEETEEEESERYSRSRSRSRSFNEHDSEVPAVIPVDPSLLINQNSSGGAGAGQAKSETAPIGERSGPLEKRQVAVLKKGLEDAMPLPKQEELIEEEEEKRLAESEKKKRHQTAQLVMSHPEMSNSASEIQMRRVKILILGDSGVGKSSLIMRWTADTFSANIIGTVGVNFKTKKIVINNENIQVQVWDTAGQEHFHKITTSYYRGAHGIMLVYDVSDSRTMDNAEYWIKNIKAHASETVHVALIGNKADLRSSAESATACTDPVLATTYAQKFGVPYFETSAKESTNVDTAFMNMVKEIVGQQKGPPLSAAASSSSSSSLGSHTGHHAHSAVATGVGGGGGGEGMKSKIAEKVGKMKGVYDSIRSAAGGTSLSSNNEKEKSVLRPGEKKTPVAGKSDDKEKCVLQ